MTNDDWCTPRWVLDEIESFSGAIDFDPCSNAGSLVGARKASFDISSDGLNNPWHPWGVTYVNPPYSKPNLELWSDKVVKEYKKDKAREVFLLIPAAVSTKWWFRNVVKEATAVCFYNRRIKFVNPDTGKPQGSGKFNNALVYYGAGKTAFLRHFKECGHWAVIP